MTSSSAPSTDTAAPQSASQLRSRLRRMLKPTPFKVALVISLFWLVVHLSVESLSDGQSVAQSGFSKSGLIQRLELGAMDAKFLLRRPRAFTPKVVVAKIDEKSIERFGLFPWPRSRMAELITKLEALHVKAIGLDMTFSDQDRHTQAPIQSAIEKALTQLTQAEKTPALRAAQATLMSIGALADPDAVLAHAALQAQARVVMGYFIFKHASEMQGMARERLAQNRTQVLKSALHEVALSASLEQAARGTLITRENPELIRNLQVPSAMGIQAPIPLIARSAAHLAYFNVTPDIDGHLRRLGLLYRSDDVLLPSLSLLTAARYLDAQIVPVLSPISTRLLEGVYLNGLIPTDSAGEMWISYQGDPEQLIPSYSIVDVLDDKVPLEQLSGKAVLVGATAIGTYDLRTTPFSVVTPGVFVHAMGLQNILDHQHLERFYGSAIAEALLIIVLGIALGLILPRVKMGLSGLIAALCVMALWLCDYFLLFNRGYIVHLIVPTLQLFTLFVAITIFRFVTEEREKRFIRRAFQFYLTKSVVDEVLKDTSKLQLGGDKRELTVLFSDIRNFTTISEQLQPEKLVTLLNRYLTPMTDVIFQHEGTLDKYIGDAVMAIFGAPVSQADHARRACLAALDMSRQADILDDVWLDAGLGQLRVGIGINTGPMAVGNMGSAMRFSYTVMGDHVNLASRLEGLNKVYGTGIIISQYTYVLVREEFCIRELDVVRVKGKRAPIRIYELRGPLFQRVQERRFIQCFHHGLSAYRQKDFRTAIDAFNEALVEHPEDYASLMYIERCHQMLKKPPPESWVGIFDLDHK